MKVSRNESCPCGSGLKYKKCCLAAGISWDAETAPLHSERTIPLSIIDEVMDSINQWSRSQANAEIERLVGEQPAIMTFIVEGSAALQTVARNQAFLSGLAMVLMYEKHFGRGVCQLDVNQIERCFKSTVKQLFSETETRSRKRHQPFLHRFIAEIVFDQDSESPEAPATSDLARLLVLLKTTLDVLEEAHRTEAVRQASEVIAAR